MVVMQSTFAPPMDDEHVIVRVGVSLRRHRALADIRWLHVTSLLWHEVPEPVALVTLNSSYNVFTTATTMGRVCQIIHISRI